MRYKLAPDVGGLRDAEVRCTPTVVFALRLPHASSCNLCSLPPPRVAPTKKKKKKKARVAEQTRRAADRTVQGSIPIESPGKSRVLQFVVHNYGDLRVKMYFHLKLMHGQRWAFCAMWFFCFLFPVPLCYPSSSPSARHCGKQTVHERCFSLRLPLVLYTVEQESLPKVDSVLV